MTSDDPYNITAFVEENFERCLRRREDWSAAQALKSAGGFMQTEAAGAQAPARVGLRAELERVIVEMQQLGGAIEGLEAMLGVEQGSEDWKEPAGKNLMALVWTLGPIVSGLRARVDKIGGAL